MAKQQNSWQYYARRIKTETFNKFTKQQFKKALKVMNRELNKRKKQIEDKELEKYSLYHKGYGENNNYYKDTNINVETATLGQLKQAAYRARNYLNRQNSSVEGINKSRDKMLAGFKKVNVLSQTATLDDMERLISIYNKLSHNLPDFYTRFGDYKYDIFGTYKYEIVDSSLSEDEIVVTLMEILNDTLKAKQQRQLEEDKKMKLDISSITDEYDE